ncbi:MAG: hypothetical protein JSV93_02835 [Candidatus Omnitrophota bacterium]|nr:MAG: hypothetical protein JSV93_02835 [Candidatus Omnitrophota bacterium]
MQEEKSKHKITVAAPVIIKSAAWNSLDIGGLGLRRSAESLSELCEFCLEPQIPTSRSIDDARTMIYMMWDGIYYRSYDIEFIGRQHSSNYRGLRADVTVAFFNKDTKILIEAFVFQGGEPPEKCMVFSGTAAYSTGEILGDLPKVIFSTENIGEDQYVVRPDTQAGHRLFTKRWRINACEKCKEITPHVESGIGLLFKRIFKGPNPSQQCLICGTIHRV